QLMDDLRSADVDFITIGQYLQPTRKHHPVKRFVTPDEFKSYETVAYTKGFLMVSSSPLTRSSHHAGEDFERLRAARAARLASRAVTGSPMPKHGTIRRGNQTPAPMFDLGAAVETYPEFLPWCEALAVRSRKERDGVTILVADMTVGYKALRETFTSQVVLKPEESVIDVRYIDGPFRFLQNRWRFEAVGEAQTDIHFFIEYEF